VLTLAAAILPTATVGAQDKSKYYSVTHASEYKINWKAFYDTIDDMTTDVRQQLPHHLDIAYGSDPKQKLDIYLPKKKPVGAPVFVYIHGGGFFEGDRLHYGYVAGPMANNGIITVVMSYRLTPQFRFPDQPQDVEQALAWVYHNIKSYGGNRNRIYIAGHSAGAILAAYVAVKTDWLARMSLPANLIKGSVPISARYDLRKAVSNRPSEYTSTPESQEQASPILHIEHPPRRMIVARGGLEEAIDKPSQEFAEKLREKGSRVEVIVGDGLDHDGIAISLRDENAKLTQAILKIIKSR
jgi:acetyl esterase/lipase